MFNWLNRRKRKKAVVVGIPVGVEWHVSKPWDVRTGKDAEGNYRLIGWYKEGEREWVCAPVVKWVRFKGMLPEGGGIEFSVGDVKRFEKVFGQDRADVRARALMRGVEEGR